MGDATGDRLGAGADAVVDVVVLGMGPGGEHVGGTLAAAGLDVVGVEAGLVGGECPYWGCVPSKMMVRAGDVLAEARRVSDLAGSVDVRPDWAPVARRIREATAGWDDTAAVERFTDKGGTLVRGRGRIVSTDTVQVGGERLRARRAIVVATGTSPAVPPIPGLAGTPFWTNRDAVAVTQVPASMIVIGGGPIGVELAQVFARFGSRVTVVDAADRLLPQEEPEVGERLAAVFERDGIDVVTGVDIESVEHDGEFALHLATDEPGDDQPVRGGPLRAERLLVATGRRIDLEGIGAAALGIDADADSLPIDDRLRVVDGVWAIGDVTRQGLFTHVALHHAAIAAADILGEPVEPRLSSAIPRVTFTDPEVGSVGLTVAAARDRGIDVAVGTATVSSTARGWMHGTGNDGLIVLVADRAAGVLVGATAMAPSGGEVLGMLTLAVHAAVPLDRLRSMIYAYPTFHGGVKDALRDLSRG